jgi:sodium/potassium-transporting ATPase subunit alpha
VNDSPALKKADIGLSMGITGTEVSKAISDMVLMDDNVASVVDAVEVGRRGFENLKKILTYSLTDNVAEMYCFCICILLDIPSCLGTMAILLTVLGTDLAPAMSLMFETSETDVMKMKPRNPAKDKLITSQYDDKLIHTCKINLNDA